MSKLVPASSNDEIFDEIYEIKQELSAYLQNSDYLSNEKIEATFNALVQIICALTVSSDAEIDHVFKLIGHWMAAYEKELKEVIEPKLTKRDKTLN